jgi:hypothetical protein
VSPPLYGDVFLAWAAVRCQKSELLVAFVTSSATMLCCRLRHLWAAAMCKVHWEFGIVVQAVVLGFWPVFLKTV